VVFWFHALVSQNNYFWKSSSQKPFSEAEEVILTGSLMQEEHLWYRINKYQVEHFISMIHIG